MKTFLIERVVISVLYCQLHDSLYKNVIRQNCLSQFAFTMLILSYSSMKTSETSKSSNICDSSLLSSSGDKFINTERSLWPSSFSRLPSIFSSDFDNTDFPKFKDDQVKDLFKPAFLPFGTPPSLKNHLALPLPTNHWSISRHQKVLRYHG